MLERTLVFVDTSYLLASFYNSWETGARSQLEIDLPEVVSVIQRMAVNQLDQPVHRQNWYDGIPDSGPHRYQRALRSEPGVQLRAGQLIEWGDRRTQKAVDTRLVADMVKAALTGTCSDIILVSGDADMIPGVEEAVDAGVRVHLYGFGWDSMSSNLRFACDSTTILDPREDFRDCMRLQILEGPLPAAVSCPTRENEDAESAEDMPDAPDAPDAPVSTTEPAPESQAQYKPLGDAQPVEDLSGTSVVPDLRKRKRHPAAPAPVEDTSDTSDTENTSNTEVAEAEQDDAAQTPAAEVAEVADKPVPETATDAAAAADAASEVAADAASGAQGTAPDAEQPAPAPLTPGGAPECADDTPAARPNPSMMAPRRRVRSRYVPLPTEIWQSAGEQSPFDVGQQYAVWWYEHAATPGQREDVHTLSGGGLPQAINQPLVQFACQTLHEVTLSENQRIHLRDGFHSGIRGILRNPRGH
ncbi:NYN domain-containing protein [Corynebacterium variabile]|uniref:NYN domain-containing protein n=1 Tax=Corynebacterium variabile TaxID=1727 RepID=UPI001D8D8AED|nr:NYN domain-containing protein [Corynebacterium variabile]HJG45776.1 NYN domain-containing protein [Corynebacterium variabile]